MVNYYEPEPEAAAAGHPVGANLASTVVAQDHAPVAERVQVKVLPLRVSAAEPPNAPAILASPVAVVGYVIVKPDMC